MSSLVQGRTHCVWIVFVLMMAPMAVAGTVVVNFDAAPTGPLAYGASYTESGLKATSYSNYSQLLASGGLPWYLSNGLYFHGTNEYIHFEMSNGSTFDLLSLVMVTNGNYTNPTPRTIYSSKGGSVAPVLPDAQPGVVATIPLGGADFTGISWFEVSTVWFATEVDDITIQTQSDVPEPGSLALVGSALLGLVVFRCNRR
jgi:hypothetical protein